MPAEGYARATGEVGVALVTSGPGATNLVTPLADAKMDSTPIVGISGQVYSHLIGRDAFQETPITIVTQAVTKHNYLVKQTKDVARSVREAFHIASTWRCPGPVLVDITKDAQEQAIYTKDIQRDFKLPGYQLTEAPQIPAQRLEEVCDAIKKAKRPLLYIGQGIVLGQAWDELKKFVEKTGIPVTSTVLGLGAFPGDHPLYFGMLGMHGAAYANFAIDQADLVICLVCRFDDRVTGKVSEFINNAFIIHVDIDKSELNKNKSAHIAVHGRVKDFLAEIVKKAPKADIGDWVKHLEPPRSRYPMAYDKGDGSFIKPQALLQAVDAAVKGKRTIYTTGVGQHQMLGRPVPDLPRAPPSSPAPAPAPWASASPAPWARPWAVPQQHHQHRRRRQLRDEHQRVAHLLRPPDPGEDHHPQQQDLRDGRPVAAPLLRQELQQRGVQQVPAIRRRREGPLRHRVHGHRQARRHGRRHRRHAQVRRALCP